MNGLVSTFLAGMLLASIALNVHQWKGASCGEPTAANQNVEQPTMPMPADFDVGNLQLSEAQQQALSQCGEGCYCEAMALREQVREATVALQEACAAAEVDEKQLQQLAANLCDLREREVSEHIQAMLSVRQVLEPEQLEELYQIVAQRECMK